MKTINLKKGDMIDIIVEGVGTMTIIVSDDNPCAYISGEVKKSKACLAISDKDSTVWAGVDENAENSIAEGCKNTEVYFGARLEI